MSKKILLRYYSANNLGDDLFAEILCSRYKNSFTTLSRMRNTPKYSKENIKHIGGPAVHILSRTIDILLNRRGVLESLLARYHDIFVYVGGSIFIEGRSIDKWRKESKFYNKLRIPYLILGSNLGPYTTSEFLDIVQDIMAGARDVCIRDKYSYDIVHHLPNTRLASDIVFNLNTSNYMNTNEPKIVFSIIDTASRFDDIKLSDGYVDKIIELTKKAIDEGKEVVYMSFCKKEGDEKAIKFILDKLPPIYASQIRLHKYRGDINAAMNEIASCDTVVASRFHAMILGLVFTKKILPLAYSDKMINVLKDMKFAGHIFDIRNIDTFNVKAVDFESMPIADVTPQVISAKQHFLVLDKILAKRN